MAILLYLNLWLLTRLAFTFNDARVSRHTLAVMLLVQSLFLALLTPALPAALLFIAVIGTLLMSERWLPSRWINESRFLGLIVLTTLAYLLEKLFAPTFWIYPQLEHDHIRPIMVGVFGFLLVANESNLLIRMLFHRLTLEPKNLTTDTTDDREYNAGRVIGTLERWIIYTVLTIAHNYNVIALVLAAKGFARFRQLREREFAEYVLIGTLASVLITVLIAEGVRHWV